MRKSFQRPDLESNVAALALTLTLVFTAAAPADAAVVNWIGGSSFWDLATNWGSNPLLPGTGADVVINVAGTQTVTHRSGADTINSLSIQGGDMLAVTGGSLTVANTFSAAAATSVSGGTLTLNGASSMQSLAQSGGTLGGTGQLTIAAPSSWLAGTQTGSATTRYQSDLSLTGAGNKLLSVGRTVELNGTTTWGGNTAANNGALQFAGATLNNKGTFNDQNAFASLIDQLSGTNAFNNIGTYNKQANTVTSVVALYNNTGTTNVNAGTMLFQGTSTTSSTGVFNIAAGATLEFRNGSHTLDHPTIQGPGTFAVTTDNVGADAVVTLNGGTLTSPFLLSGSTITGTDRTFQGPATWTGGAFSGTATTTFANNLTISGPNTKVFVGGGTINLEGTTTWAGNTADNNNSIQFTNGGTINNHGTFNDANGFASFIEHNVGGPHNFNNVGTYNKLSNTITTVDLGVAFNNSGVVNVNAGSFRPSGGTSTGTFNVAAGAVLDFKNGNNVLNGVTVQGLGTLAISSDLVGADALVTINGGTYTTPFVFSGSVLSGDAHTFQGPVTWTGGTISGAGTTTFANDVTISGANTKAVANARVLNLEGTTTWSGNTAANNNSIQFTNGATINNHGTFNDANPFASFIEHNVGGPHNFNNLGTYNKLMDTLTTVDLGVVFNNSGTLNIDAGTMRFFSGTQGPTGTVKVASGATYQHDANSTMGTLTTAGTLNLGLNTLTISADYDNANFGTGNAFNRRANVVTTGAGNRLIAAADANQGISGATVVNGNTATPTLMIGNVHVGSTTYNYNIANTGSTGPALRGAIQTSVNGGHITDPRLSGNGVSAGNWGPLATGASLARDVVVTVGAAGSLAPLTGQSVAIINNFENTRSQVVTFGLAANAAAYRLADPNALAPIAFGNVHVGDAVSQALTIRNLAPSDGFSEKLNATFGSANDARITFAGSVAGLAAGSSNASNMAVGLSTAAAGSVNGAVTVNFASDGTGTSGLGITPLPSQSVGVTGVIATVGNVFRLASASPATPNPVDFGNVRVGSVATQALTITNTAANDGFSEKLNASIGGATAKVTAAGSFNLLAPQASNNSALVVGIDTSSAGARAGTATITLASDGTGTSGLGVTPLAPQTVALSGAVYRLANPALVPPSVALAARVGDVAPAAALGVTNVSPDAYTERLNAGFGAVSPGFAGSGSITGLAAGASSNALGVSLNTGVAGSFTGTAAVNFVSSGAGTTGAPDAALPSQSVALTGHIYAPAIAQANTAIVDFGIVHRGDVVTDRAVSVTNAAGGSALNDTLQASLGAAPAGFTASGGVTGLAAGATDNGSLRVGLNTATAGTFGGNANIAFASHDGDLADLGLGNATVALHGQVNNFAEASLTKTGAGTLSRSGNTYTLDFGTLSPGAGPQSTSLAVLNSAIGPADLLSGSFDLGGVGPRLTLAGFGSFANLVAGASFGGLDVTFDDDAAGAFLATLVLQASGSNASGFEGRLDDTTVVIRGEVAVAAVPEPGTYALMISGLLVVASVARRRRQRRDTP
jgi:PEP-CTERM motif